MQLLLHFSFESIEIKETVVELLTVVFCLMLSAFVHTCFDSKKRKDFRSKLGSRSGFSADDLHGNSVSVHSRKK